MRQRTAILICTAMLVAVVGKATEKTFDVVAAWLTPAQVDVYDEFYTTKPTASGREKQGTYYTEPFPKLDKTKRSGTIDYGGGGWSK